MLQHRIGGAAPTDHQAPPHLSRSQICHGMSTAMCFGGHSGMVLTGDPWDQGLTPERAPQSLSFVNTRIAQPCFRIVSRCFFTRGKSSRKNRSRGGGSKEPPDKMLERRLLPEPLWAKWHLHRKCLLLRTSTHPTTSSE